jgi:hypothetical protein
MLDGNLNANPKILCQQRSQVPEGNNGKECFMINVVVLSVKANEKEDRQC